MSDDVTITVRVNNQTTAGLRDVNGQLRTLDGRFAASAGSMRRSGSAMSSALVDVRASLLSLAPAAVPVAASLAPIATQAGAAGLAVAAFGAAVVPQIANLKDAADAQAKYTDAVTKYGAHSAQAVAAQQQASQVLAGMPRATQQAAAAYSNLKAEFKDFSDSTAKFTMAPVEKSFAVLGQVIPKLRPMAEGAATQLDRLVTVAGGEVNSAGFDALSKKVSDFSNNALRDATNRAIHFMRVMSEGNASGPMTEFFAYARAQGPAVKELLSNLMQALGNVARGAADAGPGLLTVVNAIAKLVAAVPPGLIGNLMQVYAAFKLITLAGAGIAAVGGGIQSLAARVAALRAASAAAGGGLAGLRAAFMSLGAAAKATVVVAGIAAVVTVLSKLSSIGEKAPPDVDRLTTSLGNLGRTGKATGYAAEVFGAKFEGLRSKIDKVINPSVVESVNNWGHKWSGHLLAAGDATEEFNKVADSTDKALTNLVRGGKADLAAAALKNITKGMSTGQLDKFRGKLDDYKSALADAKFEEQLAAESQGLFGQAAQKTQKALAEQKASADGLRQSIQALNDVQRAGLGGMIGFEAAIDAAAKAAKENHGALSMTNGVLDLNSDKARTAASALQDLADKTDSAAAANRESTGSWEGAIGIYKRGRAALIKNAEAMGLSKTEAAALADQILKIPNKTARFKMDAEDAKAGLQSFNAAVKRTPGAKSVTLKTLSSGAEKILESFGFKVKRLPNGRVAVSARAGGALSQIGNVAGALARLNGRTATTYVVTNYTQRRNKGYAGNSATGGHARGGPVRGYASGGNVQAYPDGGYVEGPGSGTSDDILTLLGSGNVIRSSNTEFIVNAKATAKHRRLLELINADQLPRFAKGGMSQSMKDARLELTGYARGGRVTRAQAKARAKARAKAEREARSEARGDLTVSHFGRRAGFRLTEFQHALGRPADIKSLVGSMNQWRGIIKKATHGDIERRLLHALDAAGKGLIKYEKSLSRVNASLEKAKGKLDDLKNSASQLSSSVKSGVLSSANITKGAGADKTVTVASIMGGLTESRDKATAFAGALKGLKKKGLSKSLIRQIAEAGIEGGGLETAGALLTASKSEIGSLNSLQSQIGKAATSAGKTTADAVYGAALKAQQKLVDSLKKQQDKLEKSMAHLAKVMEKAISRAIGKKAAGGIVGAAASGGLRGGLTWVGEHEPELLDLPVGSRVRSGPDSRRMAAAMGGGGSNAPIVINLRFGTREFGQLWIDTGRHEVRTRGGIQAALQAPA